MERAAGIEGRTLRRFEASEGPRLIGPADGKAVDLGSVGVRFMAWTEETGGGFSLIEHPIPPRTLVAPRHRHSNEDEYSYVIEGRMGALLGDDVVYANVGDFVFKPRQQWHTFWNPDDAPCRILEIISPGGFEHFFDELGELREQGAGPEKLPALGEKYGLEFQPERTQEICEAHGLWFPEA
jgi:mannose-6-phosphate isomerase-like protein (cupin superfamily)